MDILSLFGTSIPAYFVIGPLVVVAIILIALIVKASKNQAPVVATQATSTPAAPVTTPIKNDAQDIPKATEVVSPQTVAPAAVPVEAPAPAPAPKVEAVVPPISSWKPSAPVAAPIPAPETAVVPEAQMAPTEITTQAEVLPTPSPVEAVPSTEQAPVTVAQGETKATF